MHDGSVEIFPARRLAVHVDERGGKRTADAGKLHIIRRSFIEIPSNAAAVVVESYFAGFWGAGNFPAFGATLASFFFSLLATRSAKLRYCTNIPIRSMDLCAANARPWETSRRYHLPRSHP